MKPLQVAKLLTVFDLSAAGTVLLTDYNHANEAQLPPPKPTSQAGNPLCSTISQILTDKCTLTEMEGGAKALHYTLTASTENVTVKVANGREPSLTIKNTRLATEILQDTCSIGKLRFDLDAPKNFFLTGQVTVTEAACQ